MRQFRLPTQDGLAQRQRQNASLTVSIGSEITRCRVKYIIALVCLRIHVEIAINGLIDLIFKGADELSHLNTLLFLLPLTGDKFVADMQCRKQ